MKLKDYEYKIFYEILEASVIKNYFDKTPASKAVINSNTIWKEIGYNEFLHKLCGGKSHRYDYFYKKYSEAKNIDKTEINVEELALIQCLKYINIAIPPNKIPSHFLSIHEEAKLLLDEFRVSKVKVPKSDNSKAKDITTSSQASVLIEDIPNQLGLFAQQHLKMLSGQNYWCFFHDFFSENKESQFWLLNQGLISFNQITDSNIEVDLTIEIETNFSKKDSERQFENFKGFTDLQSSYGLNVIVKLFTSEDTLILVLINDNLNALKKLPNDTIIGQYIRLGNDYSVSGGVILERCHNLKVGLIPKTHKVNYPLTFNSVPNDDEKNKIMYEWDKFVNNETINFLQNKSLNWRKVRYDLDEYLKRFGEFLDWAEKEKIYETKSSGSDL